MNKIVLVLVAIILTAGSVSAQVAHSVTLSWVASLDSITSNPGTTSIFRAPGACPASGISGLTFTKLASNQSPAGPYTDSTVTVGTWCYYVAADIGGAESGPSNTFQAPILPAPPTTLTAVVK